jgi:hypothetical protein
LLIVGEAIFWEGGMNKVLLTAALLAAATGAHAASYSQSVGPITYSFYDAGSEGTNYLSGFDESLGTLTSVSVNVVGFEHFDAIVNDGQLPSGTPIDFEMGAALQGPGPTTFSQTVVTASVISFGGHASDTNAINVSGTYSSALALSEFLQPTVGFVVDADGASVLLQHHDDSDLITTPYFTLTETFNYVPVPEPASIVLPGGSLLVLATLRRRAGKCQPR